MVDLSAAIRPRVSLNVRQQSIRLIALGFSGSILLGLTAWLEMNGTFGAGSMGLRLLGLAIGSWGGLAACGRLADAYLATVRSEDRQRILEDRFVGSFGSVMIVGCLLLELVGAMTLPAVRLAALPAAAITAGSAAGMLSTQGGPAHSWSIGAVLILIGQVVVCHWLGAGLVASITVAISALMAAIIAARARFPSGLVAPFSGQIALLASLLVAVP